MAQPEFEWTEQDNWDAIAYAEEAARASGVYFYPEEVHLPAYEVAISLAKSALTLIGTRDDEGLAGKFGQPLRERYERLADASLNVAAIVFKKIPVASLHKLEYERRRQTIHPLPDKQPGSERKRPKDTATFLNGEVESPPMRYGMHADWMTESFKHFRGRPLSKKAIAKLLFGEELSEATAPVILNRTNSNMVNVLRSRFVEKAFAEDGLKLIRYQVFNNGRLPEARFAAVAVDYPEDVPLPEELMPTDEELKEMAIRLRLGEKKRTRALNRGQRISQTRFKNAQIEKAWQKREAELESIDISFRKKAERWYQKEQKTAEREGKMALNAARGEIRQRQTILDQQERAWLGHERQDRAGKKGQTELAARQEKQHEQEQRKIAKKEQTELEKAVRQEIKAWQEEELWEEGMTVSVHPAAAREGKTDEIDPESGLPLSFIQEIEALEERLRHPPPHDEIIRILKESGWRD